MTISKPAQERSSIEDCVRKQLGVLFTEFYASSPQYESLTQSAPRFSEILDKACALVETMNSLLSLVKAAPEKAPPMASKERIKALRVLEAISYLSFVEQIGNMAVNMAVLLLVAKGVDFHLEPDYEHRYTRHARSLEEIESPGLPLSKLDFLKLNGLTFFSKWIDRDLRNCIAHLDFEIDDNVDLIVLRKAKRRRIDL
jgi:hypothetical protein